MSEEKSSKAKNFFLFFWEKFVAVYLLLIVGLGYFMEKIRSFFSSQISLLLTMAVMAGMAFGMDVLSRNFGYLILHIFFVVVAVRCLVLRLKPLRVAPQKGIVAPTNNKETDAPFVSLTEM